MELEPFQASQLQEGFLSRAGLAAVQNDGGERFGLHFWVTKLDARKEQ